MPAHVYDILKQSYITIASQTYLKGEKNRKIFFLDRRLFIRLSVCASIVMLAGVFYFIKQYLQTTTVPIVYSQTTTLRGERKQLILSDGTKIWLSPGSSLRYADVFRGKTREVDLEGEAFFEVKHDTQHPFIIHIDRLSTTVLGTTFNIQAYQQNATVEVTLLSGKVAIADAGKRDSPLILCPKQKAIFNKANGSLNKVDCPNAADLLARRDGKFIYKGVALSNVLNDISQAYNVNIALDKNAPNLSYYGEFDQKENVQSVLMQISLSANLKLKNKGATWQLYK